MIQEPPVKNKTKIKDTDDYIITKTFIKDTGYSKSFS